MTAREMLDDLRRHYADAEVQKHALRHWIPTVLKTTRQNWQRLTTPDRPLTRASGDLFRRLCVLHDAHCPRKTVLHIKPLGLPRQEFPWRKWK